MLTFWVVKSCWSINLVCIIYIVVPMLWGKLGKAMGEAACHATDTVRTKREGAVHGRPTAQGVMKMYGTNVNECMNICKYVNLWINSLRFKKRH